MACALFFVLALLACTGIGRARAAEQGCVTCHPDVNTQYAASVHAGELGCTECHGGDPQRTDLKAHAADQGYVGKPERPGIPALCARCHADARRMKPFHLPTDQHAQYLTSEHGLLLARGDSRAAVCTDCHGVHLILAARQPVSPVARQNIPATCGKCHSDRGLMAAFGIPANQEELFERSIHGVALRAQHPAAPTCTSCHGAHGASLPAGGAAAAACGQCHARTRAYFNESPHRRAAMAGEMGECTSCHEVHDTVPPGRDLFDFACRGCHPPESEAFAAGQKLKALLLQAEESLAAAEAEIERAEKAFPTAARYRAALRSGRAAFMEALPLQHSLHLDRVEDLARTARSTAEDVRAAVHGMQAERQVRYVALAAIWLFALFTVSVAILYLRDRRRAPAGTGPSADRSAP